MKTALISGISGQDGSYLAELLLEKGYSVYGMVRRECTEKFERIEHIRHKLQLRQADLLDQFSIIKLIEEAKPDEIYNLASQSFVPTSWAQPILSADFNAIGVTKMLEAVRLVNKKIRFYQASSSEMFGKVSQVPQNELTPFNPRTLYGAAKVYGHFVTVNYRESYDIFAVSGILYNHESPRRGLEFVTRKITNGVAKIKYGLEDKIILGNLLAERDWGYAKDYVEAMWKMLQQDSPEDYVIATGISHSVKNFCEIAFNHAGLEMEKHIETDMKFFRQAEGYSLVGDATKALKKLEWKASTPFENLVRMMVDSDCECILKQQK
ncbi:MAG: GDP-mannose 4,6-dehydratase [Bacteroidota bacterium]